MYEYIAEITLSWKTGYIWGSYRRITPLQKTDFGHMTTVDIGVCDFLNLEYKR